MTKSLQSWEEIVVGFRIFKWKSKKRFDGKSVQAKHLADSGKLERFTQVTKRFKLKSKKRFDGKSVQAKHVADSGKLERFPQVTKRFKLKPGKYLIIPFTQYANQESEFLLRIFSEKPSDLELLA